MYSRRDTNSASQILRIRRRNEVYSALSRLVSIIPTQSILSSFLPFQVVPILLTSTEAVCFQGQNYCTNQTSANVQEKTKPYPDHTYVEGASEMDPTEDIIEVYNTETKVEPEDSESEDQDKVNMKDNNIQIKANASDLESDPEYFGCESV